MLALDAGKVASPDLYDRACYESALRDRIGDAFDTLSKAHVAIAGLGGLGSNVSIFLARCGVGHLHLIDFDHVEASNLNRQQYRVDDLGRFKSEALSEIVSSINPFIEVQADTVRIDETNVESLLQGVDVICEAFDSPDAKAMLVNSVLAHFPNTFLVSGIGMAGCGPSNMIETHRVSKYFWTCGDGESDVAEVGSLFAPRVAICAGHQGNLIIELLLGMEDEVDEYGT